MAEYVYDTCGTCSREIALVIENDIIISVKFKGGCNGNLQGLSKLVEGSCVFDIIEKFKGIDCGGKGTSCPDQLARALIKYCKI
jgi:uncharacterized protein TIGR03905